MNEAKRRGRSAMKLSAAVESCDILMAGLTVDEPSNNSFPKGIGIVQQDDRMLAHKCLWVDYPEKPERLQRSLERCGHYGLLKRCVPVASRLATEAEILRCHSQELYDLVRSSASMTEEQLQKLSSHFDAVYFNQFSFEAAMLAAGSTVEIVDQVVNKKIRHGMALVRPPGHHSMYNESNGYCIFNNAAIAARHAVDVLKLKRVLIVDWDLHHGQGTQYAFYDDPRFLYFSIHRYEHGTFWPNLRESDYDYIGQGKGRGYNINVPFNKVGMTDGDYMAIMQQILMPVAYEFNPQLVIVSCGYDAAIGDPEGRSEVTPAVYAHFTHMMKQLAGGKLLILFEGGYCLKSLAEGVALTLHCLLDDLCPQLDPLPLPMDCTIQAILHVIRVLRPFWKCFQYQHNACNDTELPSFFRQIEIPKAGVVFATAENKPETFSLEEFERLDEDQVLELDKQIDLLIEKTKVFIPANRTCLVYDEDMCKHQPVNCPGHVEDPSRVTRIMTMLTDEGLASRCLVVPARVATKDEVALVHSTEYIESVEKWSSLSDDELAQVACNYVSIYLSSGTSSSAFLAVGATLNVVDEVVSGKSLNGLAIVRPPGHHAEIAMPYGFCIFNNVSIAAKYAQTKHHVGKVLILDWDVHHGNGIQNIFEEDPSVLYISIHRGDMFPMSDVKHASKVGKGAGEGFNINIPWRTGCMGDAEYIAAFQQIVLPVAYEFGPDLVIVSAGFDAALGDPLGNCRVTPTGYAHMTHMLSTLAGGKLILVLEGGYNLNSNSLSACACVSILLGDRLPVLKGSSIPRTAAVQTINYVLMKQRRYWKSLAFQERMPSRKHTLEWLGDSLPSQNAKVNEILHNEEQEECKIQTDSSVSSSSEADSAVVVPIESTDCVVPHESTVSVSSDGIMVEKTEGAVGGVNTDDLNTAWNEALKKIVPDQDSLELFAVEPLPYCPHLASVEPVPPRGLDTQAECLECGNVGENWVCLSCYQVHCSRYVNSHMESHRFGSDHPMVLSYADLSVWCYSCDSYVHNAALLPAKQAAHLDKFGFNLPV